MRSCRLRLWFVRRGGDGELLESRTDCNTPPVLRQEGVGLHLWTQPLSLETCLKARMRGLTSARVAQISIRPWDHMPLRARSLG